MNSVKAATKSIQRRLVMFVLRAIAVVFGLAVLISMVFVAFQLRRETQFNPYINTPPVGLLEAYYQGNGSWDGIDRIAQGVPGFAGPGTGQRPLAVWENTILVDNGGKIVLDHGSAATTAVGTVYQPTANDRVTNLTVNNQVVGKLYTERTFIPGEWSLVVRVMGSALLFSIVPGILILVIGLALMNRLLTPLSQVIGATQAVARGDLSARVPVRQRHDDLQSLSEGFNYMAESLEHNDRERRSLFADIAHELRTPLTVLRGRLEGVMDGVYPPSQEVIAPALEETYMLERLVEDLRLLALAEAHQLPIQPEDVDLQPLIQRATELFTAQAAEKQVNIQSSVDPEIHCIHADPQRFEQVLGNLLDNALRYAPAGSRVDIMVRPVDAGIQIDVMDEGPGVTAEDLGNIFNRFWREEKARSRSEGGSGLGLAIAKQLVENQGGTIQAINRKTGGLIIRVIMPGVKPG
jgi:two-component system OmpR family sensor kinase/two-component system sensor histidine kinase BaeS